MRRAVRLSIRRCIVERTIVLQTKPVRRRSVALVLSTLFALITTATHAANPEPRQLLSSPSVSLISPDSARVVYISGGGFGPVLLNSIPLAGGTSVTLNASIANPGGISAANVRISPDSQRVVYIAQQSGAVSQQVYSVPIAGTDPVMVSSAAHGPAADLTITSDSSRAVYTTTVHVNAADVAIAIFSAPLSGGSSPARLSPALASSEHIAEYAVSPDGARVVYRVVAGENDAARSTIYTVPTSGGTPVVVDSALRIGAYTSAFQIAPDSSRIAYFHLLEGETQTSLYQAPIAGGAGAALDTPADASVTSFSWSPNSADMVYLAQTAFAGPANLWSVSVAAGSTAHQLNAALPKYGTVETFQITPNAQRVLYIANQADADLVELWSVPIAGGTSAKLSGTLSPWNGSAGGKVVSPLYLTPDSHYVVYFADQIGDDSDALQMYSARVDGSAAPVRMGSFTSSSASMIVDELSFAPDGSQMLYSRMSDRGDLSYDLYAAPVSGAPETLLSGTVGVGYNPNAFAPRNDFRVTPDSRSAVFYGKTPGLYVAELPNTPLPAVQHDVYLPLVIKR